MKRLLTGYTKEERQICIHEKIYMKQYSKTDKGRNMNEVWGKIKTLYRIIFWKGETVNTNVDEVHLIKYFWMERQY